MKAICLPPAFSHIKHLHLRFFSLLVVLSAIAAAANASERNTVDLLYADPYGHLDQSVVVKVVSVHPEHHESEIRDVVWFRAFTGTKEIQGGQLRLKPGGEILVAVDSTSSASFFQAYGDGHPGRPEAFQPTHNLTGTFRAFDRLLKEEANKRRVDHVEINNGAYFIDCTTKDQFKNVESPSPSPSPSPSASPTASPDTTNGGGSASPSALIGNFKALINRLGITGEKN
jgi:hypothetical protein